VRRNLNVLPRLESAVTPTSSPTSPVTVSQETVEKSNASLGTESAMTAKNFSTPPVSQEAVEKRLRPMFDLSCPDLWLSDAWWIYQQNLYQGGWYAYLALSLEIRIKNLARKYRTRPAEFASAYHRLLKRRAEKWNLPWPEKPPSPLVLPQKLSQTKLRKLRDAIPDLRVHWRNPTEIPGVKPEALFALVNFFAAEPAGRPPGETTKTIVSIAERVAARNRKLTLGQIAERVFKGYSNMASDQRHSCRKEVSRVLREVGLRHVLSKQ
jgi:hypothetical protein